MNLCYISVGRTCWSAIFGLLALGLVGCGTPKVWYQPGVSQVQTQRDLALARVIASRSVSNEQIFIPGQGAGGAFLAQALAQDGQRKDMVRDLMLAAGYRRVPVSQIPTNHPDVFDRAALTP